MSAAILLKINAIEDREAAREGQITALQQQLCAATGELKELRSERKELKAELRELAAKVETLYQLRQAIEKDAREILGTRRALIDPSQVPMPPVLKTLGYGKETR